MLIPWAGVIPPEAICPAKGGRLHWGIPIRKAIDVLFSPVQGRKYVLSIAVHTNVIHGNDQRQIRFPVPTCLDSKGFEQLTGCVEPISLRRQDTDGSDARLPAIAR